ASLCLVYADTDAGPLARSRTNALAARGESSGVAPRQARHPGVPNAAAALGAAPRWQGATTENIGQYLREEPRSQHRGSQRGSRVGVERGCIACRMQPDFRCGLLSTPSRLRVSAD